MKKIVGILGGGLMGLLIAAKFALAGYETIVVEANPESLLRLPHLVSDIFVALEAAGVIASATAISTATDGYP